MKTTVDLNRYNHHFYNIKRTKDGGIRLQGESSVFGRGFDWYAILDKDLNPVQHNVITHLPNRLLDRDVLLTLSNIKALTGVEVTVEDVVTDFILDLSAFIKESRIYFLFHAEDAEDSHANKAVVSQAYTQGVSGV